MTLTVTGRRIDISPLVRQQIQAKIDRLDRLLRDNAVSEQVVLTGERQGVLCEITLRIRGDRTLVGVGRHTRLITAVGQALEKIKQQAQRLTDRRKTLRRTGDKPAEVEARPRPASRSAARASAATTVVRARRYAVKSMTADEAALRLGTAAFLVFRQATSGRVAVVFRRPDGKAGLIEPED